MEEVILSLKGIEKSFGEGDVLTIYVTVEGTSVDYDGQLLPAVRLWFYNE